MELNFFPTPPMRLLRGPDSARDSGRDLKSSNVCCSFFCDFKEIDRGGAKLALPTAEDTCCSF